MNTLIPYGPEQKDWRETLSPLAKSKNGGLLVSPPRVDPLTLYNFEQELTTNVWYQVPSTALTEKQRERALTETVQTVKSSMKNLLGFQSNCRELSHTDCVKDFVPTFINNSGSPFVLRHDISTCMIERNVLDYYASLWHANWPHNTKDPSSYWGYILTMGSTEGNIYAMWNARDYLSGKSMRGESRESLSQCAISNYLYDQFECPEENPNAFSPVAFYSNEAHFSIAKAFKTTAVRTFYEVGVQKYPKECPLGSDWPLAVPCDGGDAGPGTIDIKALTTLVDFFSAKGHPIIVIFTYGTTFKGAYDDVKSAGEALIPILKKNGMYERQHHFSDSTLTARESCITRKGFWFHVDGALAAAYAPFLQMAYESGLTELKPPPIFDFRLDFVSSIVTSGHKWIGSPWPCGIYISKTEFLLRPSEKANISYIGSPDHTLGGSRNGHSAIIFWSYISTYSYEEQAKKAIAALEIAIYTEEKLKELESEIKTCLWVMRSPSSQAVCFKRPNEQIMRKFTLSGQTMHIDGEWRKLVHVYITCGLTTSKIDELVDSLRMPDAFNN